MARELDTGASDSAERGLLNSDRNEAGEDVEAEEAEEIFHEEEKGFEDDRALPSRPSWIFLEGRCLSSLSSQEFDVDWIYQRFVNICMHRVTDNDSPWYALALDGSRFEGQAKATLVIFYFTVAAPVLFPMVYGIGFLGLLVTFPYILSFKKATLQDVTHLNGLREKDCMYTDERRYTIKEVFVAALWSLWYFWLGIFPWMYLASGHYSCDVDPDCTEDHFITTPVLVFSPWVGCCLAAFRFTRAVLVSAGTCRCEHAQNVLVRNRFYGDAMKQVIRKLGDHTDPMSYYPIFVQSENDELSEGLPPKVGQKVLFLLFPVLQGMLPRLWIVFSYNQTLIPAHLRDLVTMLTGVMALIVEFYQFMFVLNDAIEEFEDVVEEIFLFMYVSSKGSTKNRISMATRYKAIVTENDKYRYSFQKYFRTLTGFQFLKSPDERFNATLPLTPTATKHHANGYDELTNLALYRVLFNFSRKEGVMLFRHMREWLTNDILNERLAVEMFINCAGVIVVGFLVILVYSFFKVRHVSAVWTIAPLNICLFSYYIVRSLNLCVQANEYLFDWTRRILLDWQDEVVIRTSEFSLDSTNEPAIGWVWDKDLPKPLFLEGEKPPESDPKEVYLALDMYIKRLDSLEEKQQIFGMEVTKQLRNRAVGALGSVLVALVVKVPQLWEEHAEQIQKLTRSVQKVHIG